MPAQCSRQVIPHTVCRDGLGLKCAPGCARCASRKRVVSSGANYGFLHALAPRTGREASWRRRPAIWSEQRDVCANVRFVLWSLQYTGHGCRLSSGVTALVCGYGLCCSSAVLAITISILLLVFGICARLYSCTAVHTTAVIPHRPEPRVRARYRIFRSAIVLRSPRKTRPGGAPSGISAIHLTLPMYHYHDLFDCYD